MLHYGASSLPIPVSMIAAFGCYSWIVAIGFKEAVFLFKRSHNKAVTRQVPVVLGCQRRVAYSTQTTSLSLTIIDKQIDINCL
jgi:hypothetical protein